MGGPLAPTTRIEAAATKSIVLLLFNGPSSDQGGEDLKKLLEAEGFVVVQGTPEQAPDLVRSRGPELVLVPGALVLGEKDPTLGLFDRLRRAGPNSAIVLLGGPVDRLPLAFARGAAGAIIRLDDRDEVRAVLAQAAARRRSERERLDALDDARKTRKFFEDVLRGLGEGIVVVDSEGRIRYRNPEAGRILGEEDDNTPEREGALSAMRLQQMVLAPLLQLLVETLAEREPKTKMVALEEDDRKLFLDVTTSVLKSGEGRATGAVAVVRDRSAEKLLEEQLVHTERLATLGSLLAAIAHEIANPLSVITGCAEIGHDAGVEAQKAAAKTQDPGARSSLETLSRDVSDLFDQVRDASLRCQTIANNLLQYSRRTPARVAEQDLNELIKKTLGFVGKYLGTDKIEVVLDFGTELPLVRCDAAQLQQAFTNLIDNAVHAMLGARKGVPRPPSGANATGAPKLEIRTRVDGGRAVVVIADNGHGIPPRQLERIWRPFYTTKERGTGLGLYITKRAIEHQGGTIAVESTVGVGTRFTISLPI